MVRSEKRKMRKHLLLDKLRIVEVNRISSPAKIKKINRLIGARYFDKADFLLSEQSRLRGKKNRPRQKRRGRGNTGSISLEARFPGGKLDELGVGTVVVALIFVKPCDPLHFLIRQSEIEDIQIVADVIDVL